MRCFIGLPLPESYHRLLADIIQELKALPVSGVTWTRPGNWHLTLKFLGEIQEERARSLPGALGDGLSGEKPCMAFFMQGRGGGFFPDPRRPRVFWVGLGKGRRQACDLAERVDAACAGLGFAREDREFHPHLTVARIRQAGKGRSGMAHRSQRETSSPCASTWIQMLRSMDRISWPEIRMDRMVLWESRLSPAGPDYRPLAEWRLATGALE